MMRFRLGLFLGLAIGYVLGTKAGRQRYEQIRSLWGTVSQSEPAQQLGAEMRDVASKAGHTIEQKAGEGVDKVTGMVRGGNGTETSAAGRVPPA